MVYDGIMITTIDYITDRPFTNVMPQFTNMDVDQIKELLAHGRSPLINVCMNLTSDFNKSSVIRAANAFLAQETILVGGKKYDRRGTVGMHHLELIKHADNLEEVVAYLHASDYTVYAVDNIPSYNPRVIYDVELPKKSAFVYGEEQLGLSQGSIELCDSMIYIPQRGAARSLNVAQSAAVVMAEYTRQHSFV